MASFPNLKIDPLENLNAKNDLAFLASQNSGYPANNE